MLAPEEGAYTPPALWIGASLTWCLTTRGLAACINSTSRRWGPLVLVHVLLLNFLCLFGIAAWHSPLSTVMAQLGLPGLLQRPLASTLYVAYLLVPLLQWCELLDTRPTENSVNFSE